MKNYCTPLTVAVSVHDCAATSPFADTDDKAREAERRWTEVPVDERGLTGLGLPPSSTTVAPTDGPVRAAKARWAERRWSEIAFVERALTGCGDGLPMPPCTSDMEGP